MNSEIATQVAPNFDTSTKEIKASKKKKPLRPLTFAQMHRANLGTFVRDQKGKFVSVDYIKQDGSSRTLTGRLGVYKFSKGGPNKVMAIDRPYLTVFEMKTMEYRTVDLSTVKSLRADRVVYTLVS